MEVETQHTNNMDPNETVTLRNKKTGDVKRVKRSELPSLGLPVDYVSKIDAQMKLGQAGNLDLQKLGGTDPQAALILQEAGVKPQIDPDQQLAREQGEKIKSEALSVVDDLLSRDTGAVTGLRNPLKYLTGEAQYTKNLIKELKAKLSLDARKLLKGSGQVSDKETQMLSDSVTALNTNMSNEDFIKELNKIKNSLSGVENKVDVSTDKSGGISNLLKKLVDGSLNYAKDIGVGAGMNLEPGTQKSFDATLSMAQQAEERAKKETDPEQKARLLAVAQSSRQLVSEESGKMEGKFSEDIQKPYIDRSLDVASEITALAGLPSLVKSLTTKGIPIGSVKKLLSPRANLSESRELAAEIVKKKIPTKNIIDAGKKYVLDDPMASNLSKKVLSNISTKGIKTTELLRKVKIWNKAYTSANQVGKSSKAGFYDALARAAKNEIKEKAPEVAKLTKKLDLTYKIPSMLKKGLFMTGSTAATVGGGKYLYDLLSGKSNR